MKMRRANQGQSVMEYTLLLIIVIGAFVATGSYIKRGIQGRWKESVDSLGDQYDPTNMQTNIRYSLNSISVTELKIQNDAALGGFWTNRVDFQNAVETKTGSMNVAAY